jgi:hypothetical protein
MVPSIRAKAEDPDEPEDTRSLAKFSLQLFLLLEAVVEKAVRPLANTPPNMGPGAARGPPAAGSPRCTPRRCSSSAATTRRC